ncbi:hypothetical protein IFM89_003824 [Coptis chinensis]|uniref:Uncharacterized protein n=1 Tax=Coptis chinensis TaxID=261450 RepID=A0A835HGE0_9MAGN|nr:hypothetical protein IFM89_003824 [Coptis chinensis]
MRNGNTVDVGVEYLWIPATCSLCKKTGHKDSRCPSITTQRTNVVRRTVTVPRNERQQPQQRQRNPTWDRILGATIRVKVPTSNQFQALSTEVEEEGVDEEIVEKTTQDEQASESIPVNTTMSIVSRIYASVNRERMISNVGDTTSNNEFMAIVSVPEKHTTNLSDEVVECMDNVQTVEAISAYGNFCSMVPEIQVTKTEQEQYESNREEFTVVMEELTFHEACNDFEAEREGTLKDNILQTELHLEGKKLLKVQEYFTRMANCEAEADYRHGSLFARATQDRKGH